MLIKLSKLCILGGFNSCGLTLLLCNNISIILWLHFIQLVLNGSIIGLRRSLFLIGCVHLTAHIRSNIRNSLFKHKRRRIIRTFIKISICSFLPSSRCKINANLIAIHSHLHTINTIMVSTIHNNYFIALNINKTILRTFIAPTVTILLLAQHSTNFINLLHQIQSEICIRNFRHFSSLLFTIFI